MSYIGTAKARLGRLATMKPGKTFGDARLADGIADPCIRASSFEREGKPRKNSALDLGLREEEMER
jgi:hypothetical protein